MKHLVIEDVHNSWLYCFSNPFKLGTRVSLLHHDESETRVPSLKGFVKQYNQECVHLRFSG